MCSRILIVCILAAFAGCLVQSENIKPTVSLGKVDFAPNHRRVRPDKGPTDEALYVYVEESKKKCFLEELPGETIIKGDYVYESAESNPLFIIVYDPSGKTLLHKKVENSGRFAQHSMEAGFHKVCFEPDDTKSWPSNVKRAKLELKIEIQAKEAELENDLAEKKHLNAFEQELRNFELKVDLIMKELEYSEKQETHFTAQSERISTRVVFWSIVQITLLMLAGVWQVVQLRSFFRAKKLV